MAPRILAFARCCRRCGERLPLEAFRPRRRTCIYCLDGTPKPDTVYIVVPRPRPVRRWWPRDVWHKQPRPPDE